MRVCRKGLRTSESGHWWENSSDLRRRKSKRGKGIGVVLGRVLREAAENDATNGVARLRLADHGRNRDPCRAMGGKAIDAGRDRGKSDRLKLVGAGKLKRMAIAAGEQFVLARRSAVPHGADGMDHVARGQTVTVRDLGVASGAALKRPALGEEIGSGGAMDGAVDTAAAQERSIRGVDNGGDREPGNVADTKPQAPA